MSGHSKWSKVKHQKEATDAVKGKIFTKLAKAISLAVSEGGNPDPAFNFKLRLAIEKARQQNMPKEKIERAIERGKKGNGGSSLQEIIYEAFGPHGVGIIIAAATDNKQRTASLLKNIVERGGGVLASHGSVSHLFSHVGVIHVAKNVDLEQLFADVLEITALDVREEEAAFVVITHDHDLHRVKEALTQIGKYEILSAEQSFDPQSRVVLPGDAEREHIAHFLSAIEENDDVLRVYANYS